MKNLRNGSKGSKVEKLQTQLVQLGYQIAIDSIFGDQTTSAIKDFQTRNNLLVDGIVGEKTMSLIQLRIDQLEPDLESEEPKRMGEKLTNQDVISVAKALNVEVATIKAVYEVESRGSGFLSDLRPKILFEGHVFWRQLKTLEIDPYKFVTGNEDILYSKWTRVYYEGGVKEYDRLNRAKEIHESAALAAASWGTFQIMGFNYKYCGFSTVKSYARAQYISEGEHLKAFGNFIQAVSLVKHLKSKNWAGFAREYNGAGYKANKYDEKLAAAYSKYAS